MKKLECINNVSADGIIFPNDLLLNNLKEYGLAPLNADLIGYLVKFVYLIFTYKKVTIKILKETNPEPQSELISLTRELYDRDLLVLSKGTINDIENCEFQLNEKYFYLH